MSKKLLAVLAIAAIASALVSSSVWAQMKFEVGAKGGVNLADMWGDDVDSLSSDTSVRPGFLGAAFVGANFNDNFGARLELLYAQRGQKITELGEDLTIKLDYFEIALYGVGMYPVNEQFSVHGMAGPYMGFNVVDEVSNGETVDLSEEGVDISAADFGIGVGAGAGFWATEMVKIFLDIQYNVGFISVDDTESDLTINNHGVGVTAGFAVPLGQ